MRPMISTSLLTVKRGLVSGLVLLNIVVTLTHMVLDAVTLKIICRSALRARTPKDPNKKLVDAGGEEDHQPHRRCTKHPTPAPNGEKSAQSDKPTIYIKSRHDGPTSSKPLPEFNPDDLVGRTFLLPPGDNGERLRQKSLEKWLRTLSRQMEKESKNSALYLV